MGSRIQVRAGRLLTLIGCLGSIALMGAKEKDVTRVSVSIENLKFDPATLTIHPGDIVVWTNNDDRDYSVDAKDGSFSSGNLHHGDTFEHQYKNE